MKNALMTTACLSAVAGQSLETEDEIPPASCTEALHDAAARYVAFINRVGDPHYTSFEDEVTALCAAKCKIVLNGITLFEDRELLIPHLTNAREELGSWTVEPLDLVVSTESRAVVVRYLLPTRNEGNVIAIMILRYDPDNLIAEINEVYNQFEG